MATSEERLKILQMVSDGKISADEGAKLLDALNDETKSVKPSGKFTEGSKCARFLHVRVTDTLSGKTQVNVHLPVGVINTGLKIGARFSPTIEGIDQQRLMEMVAAGECGQIADVTDEKITNMSKCFSNPSQVEQIIAQGS